MIQHRLLRTAALIALVASPVIAQTPAAKPQFGTFGMDVAGMDRAVDPGNDFYAFANGTWDRTTAIPADQSRWGGFLVLRDLSDQRTHAILEQLPADAVADSVKAAAYYRSFMDETAIEAKGATPLRPALARIAALSSARQLATAFSDGTREGISLPIALDVDLDLKNNGFYAAYLSQGGLGLPDRDYYLVEDNPRFAEARAAYKQHVAKMLALAGFADTAAKAEAIYALEAEIAKAHWSRVELRQREKIYNPVAASELATRFPGFDWPAFLAAARVPNAAKLIVQPPSAIEGAIRLTQNVPLATWKDYLAYHTIERSAGTLSRAFVDEQFAFAKVLSGTPELKVRWKRGVDLVNAGMGEAVGRVYVAQYFPPATKAKADELVANLIAAMRLRLERLTWMAPETKQKALAKLAAFRPKIGYPNKWRDYAGLEVRPGDAFGNAVRASAYNYDYRVGRLGKPIDREEWSMTPQTVNAYAAPSRVEVVFPAAILQPPFFDPDADDAINYGGIGSVIGHEISHHFDDQGRKYDPSGSLTDWWTAEDAARFKTYTDRVVGQYAAYEPLPGAHVNGELTLGENMADLAGLNVAHDAWLISLKGRPVPVIGGFTGEQRFFLGFAQVWREKGRDASVLRQLTTDPHTPGSFRAYAVRNVDAWYDAFGAKPGTKFYLSPEQRIKVW